jgi:hypothetical protein
LWGIGLAVRGDRDDRLRQGRRFDARQELDPALLAASKLVTDLTEQCAVIGDLGSTTKQEIRSSESLIYTAS